MERLRIHNGDIMLDCRAAGAESGELVILLHGFPECWTAWRQQIQPLADAGYRVVVPDMRGYGCSSRPGHHKRYHLDELITDIDAIRHYCGQSHFHLGGHDWGAAVAWWYALHHPQRLASLTIVNVPHPLTFLETLRSSPLQLLKSWYIFFFQLPVIPEWLIKRGNYALLRLTLKKTSNKGAFADEDLRYLLHSWQQPGSVRAMVNYYRALLRNIVRPAQPQITVPTRILWGERDIALSSSMASNSLQYLHNGELISYPDGSHWLTHDLPAEVSACLLEHISRHPVATESAADVL